MSTEEIIQYGWTLTCAALVLFMQAGFCCLEAGIVRHKNSINVALKNVADMCCSFIAFFIVGYGIMFGASQSGLFGSPMPFLKNADSGTILSFCFQVTFCATAATIVSGGIAERCRFLPYIIASVVIGVLIYPVFGHWVWGGGWLSEMGYHDFAGSSVVHMCGAGVALAGIQILGARADRFDENGNVNDIPASNMPLVAVGVMILTFGWIGFNGGSAALGEDSPLIITNTLLAACSGGLIVLLFSWAYGGMAPADLVLNGVLGGLVAITAGADCVSLQASCIIGGAGGLSVILGTSLLLKLKLDDAVGAVPVHGVAGLAGVALVSVFADFETMTSWGHETRLGSMTVQLIGGFTCLAWSYGIGLIMWWIISKIIPLRIGMFEEQVGLNYSEHQVASPIQDLTAALCLVGTAQKEDLLRKIDNAGSGDTVSLAQAVKNLIRAGETQAETARQMRKSLSQLHNQLSDQHEHGSQAVQASMHVVAEMGEAVDQILSYLSEHKEADSAVPLVRTVLSNTRKQLSTLLNTLPSHLAMWRGVESTIGKIDQMLDQNLKANK